MPGRVAFTVLLLAVAVLVAGAAVVQWRRGRPLVSTDGVVRDVHDVRRRSAAAFVEASGIAVLALGLLTRERPLTVLGALVTAGGALMMSVARRGLARRPRRRG